MTPADFRIMAALISGAIAGGIFLLSAMEMKRDEGGWFAASSALASVFWLVFYLACEAVLQVAMHLPLKAP